MTRDDVARLFDFTGSTAVITGGAGVLGGEIARVLAACNANIAILDRDTALGEKVISGFEAGGGRHRAFAGDVLQKAVIEETARAIIREFGLSISWSTARAGTTRARPRRLNSGSSTCQRRRSDS